MSKRSFIALPLRSKSATRSHSLPQSSKTLRTFTSDPPLRKSSSPFSAATLRSEEETKQMARNMTREWRAGDVYSPHDLSPYEMRKWRQRKRPTTDAFDALSLNPLDLYKNFSVMSEYITEMGRIRHSSSTGLRPVNQRKISKAIKRAKGLGLIPSVHRHPELIKFELEGAGRFAR